MLRRLRASGDLVAGATVTLGDDDVGTVTSAVGQLAFAYLRGGIEPGETVGVDGQAAGVEPLLPRA
jgi:hypothetical protein